MKYSKSKSDKPKPPEPLAVVSIIVVLEIQGTRIEMTEAEARETYEKIGSAIHESPNF